MSAPTKRKTGQTTGVTLEEALASAGKLASAQSPSSAPATDSIVTARSRDPLPSIRVNKVNLAEIKTALDDIVKKHLSERSFAPSLVHPTVHLSLGYGSILFALGGMAYTYKMSFIDSRPVLLVAVVGYFTLQTLLWAWKRWVEQGEVFRGKRRRLVKRIETDQVRIISSTTLLPPSAPLLSFSPHTRPSSPPNGSPRPGALDISSTSSSAPSGPISPISPSLSHPRDTSAETAGSAGSAGSSTLVNPSPSSSSDRSERSSQGPSYILQLELSTTSNNGKSLLHKARSRAERSIADFVDDEGGVEEGQVGRWLEGLLGEAGLVGAEDEGVKNE